MRVKKRRDMEDHNYFVPHRTDLIETYVSSADRGMTNLNVLNFWKIYDSAEVFKNSSGY